MDKVLYPYKVSEFKSDLMESTEIVSNTTKDSLNDISIKVKNYKCFGENPQGFDTIKPINVLIGRNNSGKSSLLDLIDYAIRPRKGYLDSSGHKGVNGGAKSAQS
jgi:ATPase involved in DNA repair